MSGMKLWSRLVISALFSALPVMAQTKPLVFYNVAVFDGYHIFARADGHGQRRDDSMGVVVFPVHGTTCDVILRPADEALYQAKAQGCDRVVVAKPVHVAT